MLTTDGEAIIPKITLDTGADSGNYIGRDILTRLPNIVERKCDHSVRLGDGQTKLEIKTKVPLTIQLLRSNDKHTEPMLIEFYIVDTLGEEAIIGAPSLTSTCLAYFIELLESICGRDPSKADQLVVQMQKLFLDIESELGRNMPDRLKIENRIEEAKKLGRAYRKERESSGASLALIGAPEAPVPPLGQILDPWTTPDLACPEEEETPDPLSIPEDVMRFMETSVEESRRLYLEMIEEHVSEEMRHAVPAVMDLLRSELAQEVFAPSSWDGMRVAPVTLRLSAELPPRHFSKARPIRPQLFENAKKEFERLRKYFYTESDSPIASPLVIAPKATEPFIRFCGDYQYVNQFIEIPQEPIPVPQHELIKAAAFEFYVDLDMANSFHQIPLSEEFSKILSIQTPWGLFRPLFLPEGVGPASGLLQYFVREIFSDFAEWTIVIFDNFLVLAHSLEDALSKLEKILKRCREFGIVLKMKKSWIGVRKVTFFGYEVTHGKWKLSDSRKVAINQIPFPQSKKDMQSFLGAALFFHHHVPNYSEWSARLYETTHVDFTWDPDSWVYDYRAHFEKFKVALTQSLELHFPDYSLPWVLRVDASGYAVGAALFQKRTGESGDTQDELIVLSSAKFSPTAKNWDTYKREAYAIYRGVYGFDYYLRGKSFDLETDHRNLQWIESSASPIVIRWRVLLQSFNFRVRHIPGKQNVFADWLSRSGSPDPDPQLRQTVRSDPKPETSVVLSVTSDPNPAFEQIMSQVHGGRNFHYGAAQTWKMAKKIFPDAHISIAAVREWVRCCPICQKTRDTGITGLPSQVLSLKPPSYRRTVGVDHVTVTPRDKNGNTCVLLVVEHFSHFPQAYAAPDYSAHQVAVALFRHFCTFGVFDQIASDPGSSFMSEVFQQLTNWLGVRHKVSLIGRHESNGCEGSGKQFLRHLTTLVLDHRLVDRWSDDTVLPLLNFELASFPTSETGGFTPFQLKYGSEDATYFQLPESGTLPSSPADLLKTLDTNIRTVRSISLKLQAEIAAERRAQAGPASQYVPGDLVLWDPKEQPTDHLPTKLTPRFYGPYEVLDQIKNDVQCKHVNLGTVHTFHVDRVKPFIGSPEDALLVSRLDQDQHLIAEIQSYTGNPFLRTSMRFKVLFADGSLVDLPLTQDLMDSAPFDAYVASVPVLFPLRYRTAAQATAAISAQNRLSITDYSVGDSVYVHLRYFDGRNRAWYDSLDLPTPPTDYVVPGRVTKWLNAARTRLQLFIPLYSSTHSFSHVDSVMYLSPTLSASATVVDDTFRALFPRLFSLTH